MKSFKIIVPAVLCGAVLAGALCACGAADSTAAGAAAAQTAQTAQTADLLAPDLSNAVTIAFTDSTAQISGSGAEAEDGVVTITQGGVYRITGTAAEGRILVNAPDETVTLVLQDADITCSYGSALYIAKADAVTVYLADGTVNTLTDGIGYTYDDDLSSAEEDEPNACLYSKADLILAGSGTLNVCGNYNNGIVGRDTLQIIGCTVKVTTLNNGIVGRDCLIITNASVQVECGGDALRSTNDSDSTLGYVSISDSALSLTAGEDGIQAETALSISGGSCTVMAGGGCETALAADASAKGLKAGLSVTLTGGEYSLNCADDAIHSNGSVLISGGSYTIATGDDGIHADESTAVTDGTITITQSYEGIEGTTVEISGGVIRITASDDGINAAGGADQSGVGPMQDSFAADSDACLVISGGVITVDAGGDGVDSNGDLTVSGGELYISASEGAGDGALDCDGTAVITGGIVVAAGSSGMAQNFGTDSTQGSILLNYTAASADPITVTDADGNVLISCTPAKSYSSVVVSCPGIVAGGSYTVEAGGQTTEVTMDSLIYGTGSMMGGMTPPNGGTPGEMGEMGTPPSNDAAPGTPPDGFGTSPDGTRTAQTAGTE